MKPSIGRIVRVKGPESNGTDEHAAIVTRVWSLVDPIGDQHSMVNLTVFLDGASPQPFGSVPMFENETEALRYRDSQHRTMRLIQERAGHRVGVSGPLVAFWPGRE